MSTDSISPPSRSSSPAAQRMRHYRKQRRQGLRSVRIRLDETDIDARALLASLVRRTSNLCFDGERVFVVTQPKRDRGQRGYAAPFDNGFQNRKALSDPDPYALRGIRVAP